MVASTPHVIIPPLHSVATRDRAKKSSDVIIEGAAAAKDILKVFGVARVSRQSFLCSQKTE